MNPTGDMNSEAAAAKIDRLIQNMQAEGNWRGETLAQVRKLIHEADPEIVEEWKWAKPSSPGIPVWSHEGGVCTGETYKQSVKLTFFRGAMLEDPEHLFTQPGTVRQAIDFHEGEKINETAFKQLIRTAVAANLEARAQKAAKKK